MTPRLWEDAVPARKGRPEEGEIERNFMQVAEAVDQVFWLYNVNPFCLIYVSPAARHIWGFDPMTDAGDTSERHSLRMMSHLHPEDAEIFYALLVDLPAATNEREYRIINTAGEVRWVRSRVFPIRDQAGEVYRIAGVTEDVTPRKQAERRLELHRTFDRVVRKVSTAFATLIRSDVDEAIHSALRDIAAVFGADCGAISLLDDSGDMLRLKWRWASSDFGPTPFPSVSFAPDDQQRVLLIQSRVSFVGDVASLPDALAETRDRLLASGFRSMVNVALLTRDSLIGVLGFGSAVEAKEWPADLDVWMERVADLFANVIDRLRREDEARNHREKLAHVLRLGTMGQLATGIAHELNQPLSAIVSYASGCVRRISDGAADSRELCGALEKISAQALRAGNVIRTLRELVKAESHLSHESLGDVVQSAFLLVEPEYRTAGIHVRFVHDPALPTIQIDRIQIEQVLLNLLQNAYDALISLPPQERREVQVTVRRIVPDLVEVSVADNGPGIVPERADTVFEDFQTSKPDGLGFGLSISRTIIEAHGGRLRLDTSHEPGACFRFTLPMSEGDHVR